jgi:hypothetical protein
VSSIGTISRPIAARGFRRGPKIACIALALLSVSAITGCQNGVTWDPLVLDPFHTSYNPLPPGFYYTDAAMAPAPPSAFANSSSGLTSSQHGSGVTGGNDTSLKQ